MCDKIRAIIADKFAVEKEKIHPHSHFKNDLWADSLDTIELLTDIEKEFGISIPDDKMEAISTVEDAVNTINELKNQNAGAKM